MDEKKLKKLGNILNLFDDRAYADSAEVSKIFNTLAKIIKEIKDSTDNTVGELKEKIDTIYQENQEFNKQLSDKTNLLNVSGLSTKKQIVSEINKLRDIIEKLKLQHGRDGLDAVVDYDKIKTETAKEVLDSIVIPLESGTTIVDKINKSEEKIKAEKIEGLSDKNYDAEIATLQNRTQLLAQIASTRSTGATTFKALTDVPSSYSGQSGKVAAVKATEDGLEFIAAGGTGTVTSVAAITLGTTGTDLSSTVANGTTTPVITLQVPTASATNRGALSAADWSTFNGKAPLVSPSFTTPTLGVASATSINKVAITAPATGSTLTIADGATLTVNGSATITNGTHSGTNTGDQTNISGNAATVTTNANLTGVITSVGNATSIASQTGTGTKFVVDTSPTLVTPTLGVATATSVNKVAITAPATSATLTIADGQTLTVNGSATITNGTHSGTNTGDQTSVSGNAGTVTVADAGGDTTTWVLLGTSQTGSLAPATDAGLTYNATDNSLSTTTFIGALTGTASGNLTSGGALGTPSSGTLTNCTGLPVNGIVDDTTSALGVGSLEVGHASDSTITRVSAGVLAIEGNNIITTNTLPAAGSSFWTLMPGTPTRVSNTTFTVTGDVTTYVAKGMIIKWTESSTVRNAMVSIPSTYGAPNTTITIVGDTMTSIDASSLKYCLVGAEMFTARFAIAGTIGATATDVANAYYATEPMRVIGADLQVGTAGTTNSTTIDINKGGTTMFTTKPTLATTVATSPTPFTADTATSLALGDKVTIDVDAIQTTSAIDLYAQLYLFPTRYNSLT